MEHKEHAKEQECEMCEGCCGHRGMCDDHEGYYDACGEDCQRMYGMRCGGRHHLLRWILGILILVLVFIAGVKVGEFKQYLRGEGYGHHMMGKHDHGMMPEHGMMMRQRENAGGNAFYYRAGMMQSEGLRGQASTTGR